MSYNLIITHTFKKDAKPLLKKYKSLKTDLAGLFGKSGGARVITYVKITSDKVFLLAIYDKSDKEDISDKELNELLKFI